MAHKFTNAIRPIFWKDSRRSKPKKTDEYLVVWALEDQKYPVTSAMEWDNDKQVWIDKFGSKDTEYQHKTNILMWAHFPKPPAGIPKELYKPEPTF